MFDNKLKKISIQKFFKIYPEIIQANENMDEIHKYYELFQRPKKGEKEDENLKLSKKFKKLSKSNIILKSLERERRNKQLTTTSNQNSKKDSSEEIQNDFIEGEELIKDEFEYYLIKKAIYLQNKKKKRTEDVKKALEIFLFNTNFIEKLTNNLSIIETSIKKSKKFTSNKKPEDNSSDEELQLKIKLKLNAIVSKLSDKVMIKKYQKNKFVLKMNEIGENCYFLLSGKLSILKPVEYKGLKVTYKQYFIFLKNLIDLKEIDLLSQILLINKKFLDIINTEEISRLIKVYFASYLKLELNKKINGITLEELEKYFKEFNYKLEDFKINKEKMMKEIKSKQELYSNINILLKNYIIQNMHTSTEDLFLLDLYNVFNIEKERKAPLVTLFRYEIFMYLYPGSFFGDSALEAGTKKRNATIRTEEECIICSLSNEFYASLIAEENKKLKVIDLQFLLNNFFFNEISANIFNRYYYPMFKLCEKNKKDVIFRSNEKLTSIFLLKNGTIKTEIYANIKDLIKLIEKIMKALYSKSNSLKTILEQMAELKKTYKRDDIILQNMENKDYFLSDKISKQIYNLYYADGFECLGILEHCLGLKYLTTCSVVSDKASFMEIKKEDLNRIIQNDREILPSYFNFVSMNALPLLKRLYFLRNNILNKFVSNLNEKKYKSIEVDNTYSNNHKPKIEIFNSEKAKTLYNKKFQKIKHKNYTIKRLESNNINSLKNLPSINDATIKNESSLLGRMNYDRFQSLNETIKKKKILKKYYLKQDESEKNRDKNNSIVNLKNKIISADLIRKRISKDIFQKKNMEKLCIVSSFHLDNNKSLFGELMNNKYLKEKHKSIEDEIAYFNRTKETITDHIRTIKGNIFKTLRNEKSALSFSKDDIKNSKKKLSNLIKDMRRRHCINLGQRKFIFYRKSRGNKVYDNLIKDIDNQSCRQNSARNIIKGYYIKKKIRGYSSIVNPLNNTYINRQKTIKVKNFANISQ